MEILVGVLIISVAALTIIGVMYIVLQEKHEHEEHFIPPTHDEKVASADDLSRG